MTPEELEVISQLIQLPLKFSFYIFIGYLGSKKLHTKVFGKLLLRPYPEQSFVTYLNFFLFYRLPVSHGSRKEQHYFPHDGS